jgi:hypothetical protein
MQTQELHDNPKQEEEPDQASTEEVLSFRSEAHASQRDEIAKVSSFSGLGWPEESR